MSSCQSNDVLVLAGGMMSLNRTVRVRDDCVEVDLSNERAVQSAIRLFGEDFTREQTCLTFSRENIDPDLLVELDDCIIGN